jgi:dCMP deaminase
MRNGNTQVQFGFTSDIVRNGGVLDKWRVENIVNIMDECDMNACYMKHLVAATTPLYSCKRPPGAAGALIRLDDKVIYGWVGPTPYMQSCNAIGCEIEDGHCIRCIHAEVQAILRAARHGIKLEGTTIFSILKPCYNCSKAIIHAGVTRIYYAGAAYDEDRTRKILKAAGVECELVDIGLEYGND